MANNLSRRQIEANEREHLNHTMTAALGALSLILVIGLAAASLIMAFSTVFE